MYFESSETILRGLKLCASGSPSPNCADKTGSPMREEVERKLDVVVIQNYNSKDTATRLRVRIKLRSDSYTKALTSKTDAERGGLFQD